MLTLILVAAAAQAGAVDMRCSGPGSVRTCHGSDGSSYVERVVGNRVIRQATGPDGETWTEYVLTEAGGTRTLGQSSTGQTWSQTCSPRSGTRGTDQNGQSVYLPPERLAVGPTITTDDEATYAPCPNTVEQYDARRAAVRELTTRERDRRDRQRRQRRDGF